VVEDFANGRRPEHGAVAISRGDDGDLDITFGAGTPVTDIAAALAELPPDAVYGDDCTTYFCGALQCDGADEPDEEHDYPVVTITFYVPQDELEEMYLGDGA
jgi:hypothetical protein